MEAQKLNLKEPIPLTCGRCGQLYVCSLKELADYLDAFPENSASPCCDDEGWLEPSDVVLYVMENHVPMCPRCGSRLRWDRKDSLESSVELIYCTGCGFREVIEFASFLNAGIKTYGGK